MLTGIVHTPQHMRLLFIDFVQVKIKKYDIVFEFSGQIICVTRFQQSRIDTVFKRLRHNSKIYVDEYINIITYLQ